MKKVWAGIEKVEELDDGTLNVFGYASSEVRDSDGELVTAEAMKAALPDYLKFGAVREMHQPIAAGTAIKAEVQDDGRTWFGAHIVDSDAVKKVQAKVYKGFSIGGKETSRDESDPTIITGLNLVEISLVDRPANPESVITMFKAEGVETDGQGMGENDTEGNDPQDDLKHKPGNTIKKGLYGVARFASLLSEVKYLQEDTAWEAEYEGDNSELPGKIKAWLAGGLELLADMVAEESAEALAGKTAKTGDLAKIEAAPCLQKIAAPDADAIQKAMADTIEKAISGLRGDLAKMAGENADLKKRLEAIESQPAPPKAILKVVGKGEDTGGDDDKGVVKIQAVHDGNGEVNPVATLIKGIHTLGRIGG